MTINQTTLTQAVTYLALAQQLSNLTSTRSSQNSLSSLLGYSSSSDLSPLLNILSGNSSTSSNSYYQNLMQMIFMSSIIKLFSKLIESLNIQQSTTESANTNTSATAESTGTTTAETKTNEGIIELTDKNMESKLRDDKGVSYVMVTGQGCGRCERFEPVKKDLNDNLGTKATFYSMDGKDANSSFWTLVKEAGDERKNFGYPIIIKCVDGKATEVYDYSDIGNATYQDSTKMTEWLSKNI